MNRHIVTENGFPKRLIGHLVLSLLKFCDTIAVPHWSITSAIYFLFSYHQYFQCIQKLQNFVTKLNQFFLVA